MTGHLDARTTRRNIGFSTVNQFFVEAAMTISQPSMVLTLFIKALGGSNFMAGLLPSLRFAGWLAPQFFAAGMMQRLHRFLPVVKVTEFVRSSLYIIIAGFTLAFGLDRPQLVLAVFFVLFMVTRLAAGTSAVARAEIIARMVPPHERATLLSYRSLAGGIAGFLAGFGVRYVLDERTAGFPYNYALLIGLSGIGFAIAAALLSAVIEPQTDIEPRKIDVKEQLARAPALLRADREYRIYVALSAASAGNAVATPFYIIYATEVLGAPAAMVGIYIAMGTLARVLSNMFWGAQCRRRGNLWVLRVGSILGIVPPTLVAIVSGLVPAPQAGAISAVAAWLFGLVFLMQGFAGAADGISRLSYLYDMAPEDERPTYYGLANTILGPLYFLPAIGGILLDMAGYALIFGVSSVFMWLALYLSMQLGQQGHRRQRAVT